MRACLHLVFAAVACWHLCACSALGPATSSAAAANQASAIPAAFVFTTQELFAKVSALPASVTSPTANFSFTHYYSWLLSQASNAAISVDGHTVFGLREALMEAEASFTSAGQIYSSVAAAEDSLGLAAGERSTYAELSSALADAVSVGHAGVAVDNNGAAAAQDSGLSNLVTLLGINMAQALGAHQYAPAALGLSDWTRRFATSSGTEPDRASHALIANQMIVILDNYAD